MNKPSRRDTAGAAYLDLQRLARSTGRPTDELLQLYALEGFLDRLSLSPHRQRLVLKGGVLLAAFDVRRPTRDIDFAASEEFRNEASVRDAVAEILQIEREDGVDFAANQAAVETIRSADPYPGWRVRVAGRLSTAKIRFHIDINVGDPILPPPELTALPRLLGGDPINLTGYTRELVLAEKIVTAISRGTANTRWRDFVDIAVLAEQQIERATVTDSITRVAAYRQVPMASLRDVLEGYAEIAQPQWEAWRTKERLLDQPERFEVVLNRVITFADPLIA